MKNYISIITLFAITFAFFSNCQPNTEQPSHQKALVFKKKGNINYNEGIYDKALLYYDSAFFYFEKEANTEECNNIKHNKALVFQTVGIDFTVENKNDSALLYFDMARKLWEELNDTENLPPVYINMASIFIRNADDKKAKYYLHSANQLIDNKVSGDLAAYYKTWGDYYFSKNVMDSFPRFYEKSAKIYLQCNDSLNYAKLFNDRGLAYSRNGNFDSAFYYYDKSLQMKRLMNDSSGIATSLNNSACVLIELKDIENAEIRLKESARIATDIVDNETLLEVYDSYVLFYNKIQNPDSANIYLKKYIELYEINFNAQKDKNIQEIEAKYQNEKKEAALIFKDAKIKQRNYYIAILLIFIVIIIVLAIKVIYSKHKQAELQKQNLFLIQEQLTQTEQMAHGLGHAIKQPVSRMTVAAQQIAETITDKNEKIIRYTQMLTNNSQTIQQKMSMLRKFGKPDSTSFEYKSLADIAEKAIRNAEIIAKQKNITVSQSLDKTNTFTMLNEDLIYDVFENLISNALEAIEKEGKISVNVTKRNKHIECTICDTGKGIPDEFLPHIFKPFYTQGKENGTGLGLSIVKHNVTLHGGTITVENSKEGGAIFKIILPTDYETNTDS